MGMVIKIFFVAVFLLSGCSVSPEPGHRFELVEGPVLTQAIITLPTRPGVQQRILIVQSEEESKGTLLLFPGGDGAGHFQESGRGFRLSNNFLVRSSDLFAQEGFTAAIVDTPSDHTSGMSDGFRTSPQHLGDIRAVVRFLASKDRRPVFLVGTSQGTFSVAYLATAIEEDRVQGIIFTSSYDQIGSLPLERIRYPVLFVHHRDDACRVTSYAAAQRLYNRFNSSAKKAFVTVGGGEQPISRPCEAQSYHGFFGKEREVVKVIAAWISGKETPSTIGQ